MRTGTVYVVSTPYGVCGPYTWKGLADYCREWWDDVAEHSDEESCEHHSDDEVIREYFDIHAEYGLSEWCQSIVITEDMLTDEENDNK